MKRSPTCWKRRPGRRGDAEVARIRAAYDELADGVIADHKSFLDITPEQVEALKRQHPGELG